MSVERERERYRLHGQRRTKSLRWPDLTAEERFWMKVDRTADCWIWKACQTPHGYGQFSVAGRIVMAHRFAYEVLVGPIPDGHVIDHLCRNRGCVNVAHMEVTDHRTNILRGTGYSARKAAQTTCKAGHVFDEHNTRLQKSKTHVSRICRECRRAYSRDWERLRRRRRKEAA